MVDRERFLFLQITEPKSLATYGPCHNQSLLEDIQGLRTVSAEAAMCHTLVHLCNICIQLTSKARNV
jgi:hypothetical protein